jgi:hypothetical protein
VNDEQPSKWAVREGVVLLAVAFACLAFQLWLPSTHVDERDYQQVAAALTTELKPTDVLLLSPWWTERARLFMPEGLRVVGYQGSDADDLLDYERVWVLAEPNLPRAGQAAFMTAFGPGRTPVGAERRFGNLSLRLFTNGRYRPHTFSGLSLAQAKVYLDGPQGQSPCQWNGRGHQCADNHAVTLEWHEVHFQPLPCLVFDAPGGATKLVLEFDDVPATERVLLRAGYVWERGAYKDGVTGSELGLEVNGQLTPLSIPAGVEPLQQVEAHDVPQGATVKVWLSATNPNARQLCVELTGLGKAP